MKKLYSVKAAHFCFFLTIDLPESLPDGTYSVAIIDGKGSVGTKKIVIAC